MLIVFSGLDGAGKSTQINLLIQSLKQANQQSIYLWTRGGYTPLFNQIKAWLRSASRGKALPESGPSQARTKALGRPTTRRLWLTLAILDLLRIYALQIRWWQQTGKVVICDRYLEDTLLDFRQNFPQEQVDQWWLWRLLIKLAPKPHLAVLLLVPVAESLHRSTQKNEPFPDSAEVLAWRLAAYENIAATHQWLVFDGRQPKEQIANKIYTAFQGLQ